MTHLWSLPCRTAPIVGPVEPWTLAGAPGLAQEPGGRSGFADEPVVVPPGPLRPPGTISVPCDRCEGGSEPPAGDEPCQPCQGAGVVDVRWAVSPHDDKAHAFMPPCGGGPSSAPRPCCHSAPTELLTDDLDAAQKCVICLLLVGDAMASAFERSVAAAIDQQRAYFSEER